MGGAPALHSLPATRRIIGMQEAGASVRELYTEFRSFQRKFDQLSRLNDSLTKFNSRFGAAMDGLALNSAAFEFEACHSPPHLSLARCPRRGHTRVR